MATMKAVRLHAFGGPDRLSVEEIERPEPQQGELLIAVRAAGVNPIDWKIREGKVFGPERLPMVLGQDVAGVVLEVGPDVDMHRVGEPVYAMVRAHGGGYGEFAVAKSSEAAPKPASLDDLHAAAVPLAAITAWQGLFDHGGLKPGQRVLIHGGSGGVGHFAVQLAKAKGAYVLATASGDGLMLVSDLGADQAIDHATVRFEDVAHDIDLVLDLVGGDTQQRSWPVLKPGGILVSTVSEPSQDLAAVHGARAKTFVAQPRAEELAAIGALIDAGRVRPVVATTLPLGAVRRAHELSQHGHPHGKIVLDVAA